MVYEKVNVEVIARPFRSEIQSGCAKLLSEYGLVPKLVGFLTSGDLSARQYAQWTAKACNDDGIKFELRECAPLDLEKRIQEANEDKNVHGILIYYPCFSSKPSFFGGSMDDFLRDSVRPEKDVEGLCFTYRYNLYHDIRFIKTLEGKTTNKKCLLPCTPLAIVKTLEGLGMFSEKKDVRLGGKIVTIINRSEIVGRPLSCMLANDNAAVISVDISSIYLLKKTVEGKLVSYDINALLLEYLEINTGNFLRDVLKLEVDDSMSEKIMQGVKESKAFALKHALALSDAVITGVPSKEFRLPVAELKESCVLVNVASCKNVEEEELKQRNAHHKYVSQVGKVTVSMLERNLLRLIENFQLSGKECRLIEPGGRLQE